MLDTLVFAESIKEKLSQKIPPVSVVEVEEAFSQWDGWWVEDDRHEHRSDPPTYWFLAETFDGRLLKVVIKPLKNSNRAYVRTAYDADTMEIYVYEKQATRYRTH